MKGNWTKHILSCNCLLKHITGGKMGKGRVMERRGRRRMYILDNLKEKEKNTRNLRMKH
jgi:hypothetical protein